MSSEDGPGIVVEALGVPVGIPVIGDDATRLRRQWSRALTDRVAETVVNVGHLDTRGQVERDYAITSLVTVAALEATAGRRINLHGGAVADERGRVLAVIGPSGAGKTTATRLLAERLGYISDETVSVDETLLVHGHPKPLSVIADPDAPHVKRSLSPDEIGLLRPPSDPRLHRIVLLHRGDADSGLVPIAPAYAIAEVVQQSSTLFEVDLPLLRLAEMIDACGGVWVLQYREIRDRLEELIGLLDRAPRPPAARVHHPGGVGRADPDTLTAGAWRRTPWLDAIEYEDELVLMIDAEVSVLAGLGLVLWRALESPRTLDELVAEVTAQWGEHADARALVEDALHVLAEPRLIIGPD